MRTSVLVPLVAVAVTLAGRAVGADTERLKNAEAVLTEMAGSSDAGIPLDLFRKAECAVIIPGVKKAALGIGGQYGRGYISCRVDDRKGWSAPAGIRIEGGSVGLQIGGSDTDVILLVMPGRGKDRLLSSRFTVGADASVAAGPVGRQASAQTDATMMAEILAWSRSRGVFAGISLQGSTLREDAGENEELYGRAITNKELVTGRVPPPAAAAGLMAALAKY
ncbi:MAG: lipid-binding SYLF domain-containing protein [Vicinamibacterales bacterium]